MGAGAGAGGTTGEGAKGDGEGGEARSDEPGWAWRNRKAVDEFQRAMEAVVDKGFSLREFGDLFEGGV